MKLFFRGRISIRQLIIIIIVVFAASGVIIGLNKLYSNRSDGLSFTKKMKIGWNLGNTFDVYNVGHYCNNITEFETAWGNPVTEKKMIDDIKAMGFNTVRIPVTWYEHMDSDGIINREWIDRIKEVVDYCIENKMYVILNIHHDPWSYPSKENLKNALFLIRTVWGQIANVFMDYDELLIFEGLNEPRLVGTEYEWKGGTEEARAIVNKLNAEFVKTIRAAGGENKSRYLMVPTYGACTDKAVIEDMSVPNDKRVIVSVHAYIPYEYALGKNASSDFNVNNVEDTKIIDEVMQRLYDNFIVRGIPVVIGEFGATSLRDDKSRAAWAEYFVKSASDRNIMCIWWDNGSDDRLNEGTLLYDRRNNEVKHIQVVQALMK